MGEGRATKNVGKGRLAQMLGDCFPKGRALDDDTFRRRHRLLSVLLAAHLPALFVFALARGFDADETALALLPAAPFLAFGRLIRERRTSSFFVTAGLVYCAAVLVYLSDGTIEAHFHFFVLIGFIALYQDWVPFAWNVVFVVISHGVGSAMAPDAMYNHHAAQHSPWTWALVHGGAVLAACMGVGTYWRQAEELQSRNMDMTSELAAAKVATAEAETARRRSESELLVHLARRNQSLLDRQLGLISGLGDDGDVYKLDHLATRMRRNAESLLVLAGEDPPRRRGESVLLADIVRAAVAEVEDYGRVDMTVHNYVEVHSAAVEDLVHLLAELAENATMYSSPTTRVRLRSLLPPSDDSETIVVVEDSGIGMPEVELARANKVLAEPPELDGSWSTLGFQVVSRLARRHGLRVWVEETPDGGLTALVALPPALVGRRHLAVSAAGAIVDGEAQVVDRSDSGDDVQWRAVDVGTAAHLRLPSLPASTVADIGRGRDSGEHRVGAVSDDQSPGSGDQVLDLNEVAGVPDVPAHDQVASLGNDPPVSVVHHDWSDDDIEAGEPDEDGQQPADAGDSLPDQAGDPEQPTSRGAGTGRSAGDRAAASAMLSQFQASQRAGRIMTGRQQDRRKEDPGDLGDE